MFDEIRNRPAPSRHVYVERPAYIITEAELKRIEQDMDMLRRMVMSGVVNELKLEKGKW